jgi:hypothetical protein
MDQNSGQCIMDICLTRHVLTDRKLGYVKIQRNKQKTKESSSCFRSLFKNSTRCPD